MNPNKLKPSPCQKEGKQRRRNLDSFEFTILLALVFYSAVTVAFIGLTTRNGQDPTGAPSQTYVR